MDKVKQVKRKQRLPDHAFIAASRTMMQFFNQDLAKFIAFDNDFDHPFAANWKAQIDTAEAEPTKKNVSDNSIQLTEAVKEQMELCRAKYSDAKHYIKKAFKGNPVILDAFGNSSFRRARGVPHLMIALMNVLAKACNKYRARLNAVGYSNDDIAEITTLAKALENARTAQQKFLWAITSATDSRIAKYNTACDTTALVSKAGKRIFKNNYAKRRKYRLPARARKTGDVIAIPTPSRPYPS